MALVLGYGNLIDSATLGGTWTNTANLKTRYLAQKAAAGAGAYLDIDLGSAQTIGLVALVSETIASGTITITAGTSAGGSTLYNSGALSIYSGTDFAKSFTDVSARYWRIATSAGGTIGRVFIGPAFKPVNNIDWNPSIAVESKTGILESLGGPEYFDERPNRRLFTGQWSWLGDAEAWTVLLAIHRSHDVSREVYLIQDDLDASYRGSTNFLARFRTLSPIEWPYLSQHAVGVELGELL
jgi:hypothetical protein